MSILKDIYEPRMRAIFKHHPKCDEIMERIMSDEDISANQYGIWYDEAEKATHDHLMQLADNMPVNSDGTVTIRRA